jgi:hypothetical protein
MALTDSAMEIQDQGVPLVGAKPKGSRRRSPGPAAQTLLAGGMKPGVPQLLPESQTVRDVAAWLDLYNKRPGVRTAKSREINDIITSFETFCNDYVVELSKLLALASPPRNWLENAVDNALLDYWEPILRAAQDNLSAQYRPLLEKGNAKLDLMQKNLEERLAPLDINIVLYFERIGKAKRYPFGKTYLIGIPLIDAYRGDWMAVPHELGHHVFWKARFSETDTGPAPAPGTNFLEEEINHAMQQLELAEDAPARKFIQKLLNDWTEEIFADVVGARIAGQEFVTAAWERISRKAEKKEDLFQSDGEHPILYLLPYIRTAAAEIPFEDKWKDLFGDIGFTDLVPRNLNGEKSEDPTIAIRDLRSAVEAYAVNITARLRKIKIDALLKGPSSVEELKHYIKSLKKDSGAKLLPGDEEQETLRSLLKPEILEKGEDWICKNGHTNSSEIRTCPRCGDSRYKFWFFPFP